MAQLIGGRACENGGISGELKHGPETSEAIREAFVRGGSINFIMYPWISAGDNIGMVPILVGEWPVLEISVSAAKCVSLDGKQWIIEGTVTRDFIRRAGETAHTNIDQVRADDLTCFYAGSYVVLHYDVLSHSGGVYLIKTGVKHERFFMLPPLPPRNVPDLWASAVIPQEKLLAYDLETNEIVEVDDYEPTTLAKMPKPSTSSEDEDGQSAGDTEEDPDDTEEESDGAEGSSDGTEEDSGDEGTTGAGGAPKRPQIGIVSKRG